MAYTRGTLKRKLLQNVKTNLSPDEWETYANEAIEQTVNAAWYRIQRIAAIDLTLNGTTVRWEIPAEDVTILPLSHQVQPSGIAAFNTAFSAVSWVYLPDGVSLAVEQGVHADGTLETGTVPVATIAATVAPAAGKVRVWYQCRVPQPTLDTSVLYLPEQFAWTHGMYAFLSLLATNAPSGDPQQWGQQAQNYQALAAQAYEESVPPYTPALMGLPTYGES